MDNQMTIFDFIQDEDPFCWDADINYIESELMRIGDKYGFKNKESDFRVWDHVPQYGFRLTHEFKIKKGVDKEREQSFINDMNRIVKEADQRGVKFDPMWGALWFRDDTGEGTLYCYTTFKDGRRKRKS